jgi:hypothetical protein
VNEEVQARLLKYLDALETGVTKAGEFAAGEIGQTVKEFIAWRVADSILGALAMLAAAGLTVWIFGRAKKYCLAKSQDQRLSSVAKEEWQIASTLSSIGQNLLPFVFLVFLCMYVHSGIKVMVAPRVVLLEEVGAIVKNYGGKK